MKKYGPSFLKFVVYFIYSFFSYRPYISASNIDNRHCLDTLRFGFFENVSSKDFHSVVSKLTDKPFLRKRSLREYQEIIENGGQLFLLSDKSAGYGIKHDGLLISVFKTEETKGLGSLVVKNALLNGATSLICADGPLRDFYESHGFEVTSRFPMTPENAGYTLEWKDDIRPDMLFMELKSFKKSKPL
jgi:hypothetical protein